MMARMVSIASFLILLFLPLKACDPLAWPIPTTNNQSWEPWRRRGEWDDKPSAPAISPGEGFFQGQRHLRSCKPLGALPLLPQRRARRSASSSKRRDRPNSLDLTFHLLREFLEMSREERLAQKARSNKILLHNIGK